MSLFDIKPWLVKKNDGTKKQVMPQTTIKGVIGLEKKLNSIETFIENLTGKKFDKLTQSETNSKGYADSIAANLKNSLPNFNGNLQDNDDLNNFKKHGIYYRGWSDTIVKNAPTNDANSKAGELITFGIDGLVTQIFISAVADSQAYVRNYSGNPSVWSTWRRIANDKDMDTLDNKAMQNRGTVGSPDFNSLTQAGYYTITSPANGKNYPPTVNWGTLEVSGQVIDTNGRLNQKYVSDDNGLIYTRQYNNSDNHWTSWVKAANQNDINDLKGQITGTENRLTQKINDSNKGLFHFETVRGQTDPTSPGPYNKHVAIKAPNVPGYSFAFWLNSSTIGTTFANYIEFPNSQQSGVWISIPDRNTTPVKINTCAVYVKSTVA